MARTVYTKWRQTPKEIKDALNNKLTSTVAYNRMKRKGIKPIITLEELRNIAKHKSTRHKIPIHISKNLFGKPHADAVEALLEDKRGNRESVIHVHPITQYYPKKYTSDIIDHELDHARVSKRLIKNYLKRKLKKRLKK